MLYDLQGAQSIDHRDRGVARYVVELARALERRAPERMAAYLLNPDLALPSGIEPLVASGKLGFVDDDGVYDQGAVLHLASPVELSLPLDRLFPPAARRAAGRVCVTVFDLIPMAMPDVYLADPGLRRRYLARIELLRGADRLLAISRYVAGDVVDRLGVDPGRVTAIPLVASAAFQPPVTRDGALRQAMAEVPGLRRSFVLCTGGSDGRKNLEVLLDAWAQLPADVRRTWQLVVAGSLPPLHRNHLEVIASQRGFADGFLCTGFITDETLVALNQSAGLMVFPSLAEGFGLPVAEALACETPAIGGDNTSIVELLSEEARFDSSSPSAIADAMHRALTDEHLRRRILEDAAARPRRTWDDIADETLAAYPSFRSRSAPSGGPKRDQNGGRVAFVSPLPPQPGGVATYSARLLAALRERCEVDAFVDGPPHQRDAMRAADGARPVAALERVEAFGGRYDAVVYNLGNSEFHTGALAALQRRPGVVLAHDVRLTNLYRFAPWQHPDGAPGGFAATLHRMYEGRLPEALGRSGSLTDDEVDRWGLLMARDVVAASTRFLTTSAFAAELARLDARPEHRHRISELPFAISDVTSPERAVDGRKGAPVIASFGVLNRTKQGAVLVRALAAMERTDARLEFVGPAGNDDAADIAAAAERAGVARRVEVVGAVDDGDYRRRLAAATVAVQLRSSTNGESSAAVGDCLAAGVPTIVTDIGANRVLPADAVVAVGPDIDATHLAVVLDELIASEGRRRSLGRAARRFAEAHSFDVAADALYRLVSSPA